MQLTLEGISKKVGPQSWLYDMSISPRSGAVTVLLGATQSGKTSLMRIMAGLDRPDRGRVRVDGQDVTGLPVRDRNVAMVYQQFINYPNLTVFENIASPLRQAGKTLPDDKLQIDRLLTRVLMLRVKMPFSSRADGLLHAVHQRRIHMLLNPGIHQHGFIFERQ